MNFLELLCGHMRVHLGRAETAVTEQFLDQSQVGAVGEEVGCECVPEDMGRNLQFRSGCIAVAGKELAHSAIGNTNPVSVDKERAIVRFLRFHQARSAL